MARIEFPDKPLYAQKHKQEPSRFAQVPFDAADVERLEEIVLGHGVVTDEPKYNKRKQGNEWRCGVHTQPDLYYPDQQEHDYEVRATGRLADLLQRSHLRPGDAALFQGYTYQQEIILESGETALVDIVSVTSFEVISRSPRVSRTVYEIEKAT